MLSFFLHKKWKSIFAFLLVLLSICGTGQKAFAQNELLDYLEKPEGMEKRKIGAEKTPDKKFTKFRAFTQNNFTYYNFYFNAKDRFDDLLKVARKKQLDKYLNDFQITWGDEDEDYMAKNSFSLDTIIAKCKAGILLHDLRTKWTDDLLLLMGKAYYYTRRYDTAFTFFQYLNNAYKNGVGGYDDETLFVDETQNKYSLATPETHRQIFARNDALIWAARALSAMGETQSAFSIINILSGDPYFPKRLKNELLQVKAYAHYQKEEYALAASTLEELYADIIQKTKINDLGTAKLLLIATLYNKGYRYHDAFRIYLRVSQKTRDRLVAMNASIELIGLDYVDKMHQQVEYVLNNKKFKKFAPEMYFKLSRKLFALNNEYDFLKVATQALALKDQLTSPEEREVRLMLASYYIRHEQYIESGGVLTDNIANTLSLEERKKYEIANPKIILDLVQKKSQIVLYDSLLQLGNLPETELVNAIRKIRKSGNQNNTKKADVEKSDTEPQAQSWYFDNDYLLIKGKQEFENTFGNIRNIDMWRNKPVTMPFDYKDNVATVNKDSLSSQSDNFIKRIPTTPLKKLAMQDSLFYALVDYAVMILNHFPNPKNARPYIQRAMHVPISETALQSFSMETLKKIGQVQPQRPTLTSTTTAETADNSSVSTPTPSDITTPMETKNDDVGNLSLYHQILDDYMSKRWDRFLQEGGYDISSLSIKEQQQVRFMQASVLLKNDQKEKGVEILHQLRDTPKIDNVLASKVADLLTYLK